MDETEIDIRLEPNKIADDYFKTHSYTEAEDYSKLVQ